MKAEWPFPVTLGSCAAETSPRAEASVVIPMKRRAARTRRRALLRALLSAETLRCVLVAAAILGLLIFNLWARGQFKRMDSELERAQSVVRETALGEDSPIIITAEGVALRG